MARPGAAFPTERELQVLKVLWQNGPRTLRQVYETLPSSNKASIKSLYWLMEAMVKKGYLAVEQRRKGEGGNLYIAKVGEAPTARNMLQSLSRRLFGGSVAHAVQHLASAGALDPKELEELRNALNELSKKSER